MQKKIAFRVMKHSASVEEYVNKHLEKVELFLEQERQPVYINIVLQPSRVHAHHRVDMRVKSPDFHVIVDFEGPEFYKVIDKCIDTLYQRLHDKKRELVQKRHKGS